MLFWFLPEREPPTKTARAMRRTATLILLVLIVVSAGAAKRVTVAQLEQGLNGSIAGHKSDEEIARHIADLELSERLTDVSLDALTKQLALRPQTAAALQILADQSSFLDPPPTELPAIAAPDDAHQQQMLDAARGYVVQTLQRLPNFLATRTICRYDDSPRASKKGDWGLRQGLWQVDTSHQEVSVSVERESQPPAQSSAVWQGQIGLFSGGEFGTTLGMIMADSVHGKITWSHWEQAAGIPTAVFQYSVPRSASHFEVIGFRERAELVGFGSVTRGSAPPKTGVRPGDPSNTTAVYTKPGYHGSFSIDPATGTVLRITVESDSKDGAPFRSAGILVQYGSVQIGEGKFICPTRSVAFSVAVPDSRALTSDAPTEWLNVTQFTAYHRFASTTRILAETPPIQPEKSRDANAQPKPTSLKENETVSEIGKAVTESGAAQLPMALESPTESSPTASSPATPLPSSSSPPAPPHAASVSTPDSSTVPPQDVASAVVPRPPLPVGEPADQPQPQHPIELNVNRVLIPVVVRDKSGRAVSDLKEEDFKVFDNGTPRPISRFLVERRGTEKTGDASGSESQQQSQISRLPVLPSRIIVFLFDDLHLSFDDLSYARKAALKAFDGLGNSDLAAVVSTSGKLNSGLTHDLAILRNALTALRPQEIYRVDPNACPKMDYYQADLIETKHDNDALQDAITQVVMVCNPRLPSNLAEDVAHTSARRILILGSQDVRSTYSAASEYVRRMAKMPGQRTLILVSSGFLTIEQESRAMESQLIDLADLSNVTISAIDARGLYTASLTAKDDTRWRQPEMVADYRRTSMKLAEDSMGELADGTGGTFFHNSNDLDAGFKGLTDAPDMVYLLEFSVDNIKLDGSYHRLKVKIDKDGLDLNARRGYLAPKTEKKKKE
jgi:VWFA-related protein